jgi:SAM-dependent methyltransferase
LRHDLHVDARDWDRRWEGKRLHAGGEPSPVVVAALESLAAGTALDLGCGAGRHAVWLAERGWRVTAVDFSTEALRQGRGRASERGVEIDWVESDLLAYEPRTAAFDLVLLAYVHVPADERRAILARAAAAVAPDGTFLLVGHDLTNIGTGAPGPTSPAVLYTSDDIVAELAGLAIARAGQVTRTVETEDGTTVEAVDALVLATRRPDRARRR